VARVGPQEIVARNIQEARRAQKLTQEALADRTDGLSSVQVSRAERGVADLRLSTIARLADGLEVPAADLLRGVGRST
jgi:transcriptional regulator with XRE-family HTH domain